MARVQRGPKSYKRRNAKNFTNRQAQARLNETVEPFNTQVENALFVNAVEVDFYQAMDDIGRPCTCEKVEIVPEHHHTTITTDSNDEATSASPVIPTPDDDNAGVSIKLQDNDLFGDSGAEKMYNDVIHFDVTDQSIDDYDDDIPEALYEETEKLEANSDYEETALFGSASNCGICYKTGFQPGYKVYGKQRHVLTNWDLDELNGYIVRTSDTPNTIVRQGPKQDYTFASFVLNVPKYFTGCTYSIRNNTQVLSDKLYMEDYVLTLDMLKRFAGRSIYIKTNAEAFTHIVLEFDLGLNKLRANLGSESESLDFSKLESISNFPVILPPSVYDVSVGDIIVVHGRRLVLKIVDKERKITADKRQLEWSVQTRLVQKTEAIRHIARNFKLL